MSFRISAFKNGRPLGVQDITKVLNDLQVNCEWWIFDLEYSGESYRGKTPLELEQGASGDGLKLGNSEFGEFGKTVNQIINGRLIGIDPDRARALGHVTRDVENPDFDIQIEDSSYWIIGGVNGKLLKSLQ